MLSLGRLHLVTDTRPGRDPLTIVRAGLSVAGPDLVVQVRIEDTASDREAYDLAVRTAELCAEAGATFLVNDRLHVALAAGAAGGHVGADDLPVAAARRVLGPAAVLGATARDPGTAAPAKTARCCSMCGPKFCRCGPVRNSWSMPNAVCRPSRRSSWPPVAPSTYR